MNNNKNTTAERAVTENASKYTIGRTTYIVKLHFNLVAQESLSDILNRLIINDCEDFLGESGQITETQAV